MVFGQRPMLKRAATAGTEMFANRFRALVASPVDMQQMPAVGMARDWLDHGDLARQSIRHINGSLRCIGDAIAAVAEATDVELLSHGPPQAGIQHCRRHLRSGRELPR